MTEIEEDFDECLHIGPTERKFGGAIICAQCSTIIGYWKPEQPKASVRR